MGKIKEYFKERSGLTVGLAALGVGIPSALLPITATTYAIEAADPFFTVLGFSCGAGLTFLSAGLTYGFVRVYLDPPRDYIPGISNDL